MVEMRDGIKLHTVVYTPNDSSVLYPIMLNRTPYGVGPYENNLMKHKLGSNKYLEQSKYIFVYQDVRGKFMSQGDFENVRPVCQSNINCVDETTDAFDTIDWLIKNLKSNKKVALWGISYGGFYTMMGLINSHPSLICANPQAPILDWFLGDDFHHNGVFLAQDLFNFIKDFGLNRDSISPIKMKGWEYQSNSPRNFFKTLTPYNQVNKLFFKSKIPFWDSLCQHPNYDQYWKNRNYENKLVDIKPAVLLTGGWYDAEDLYGSVKIKNWIRKKSPATYFKTVFGPWNHGGWVWSKGDSLGKYSFQSQTSDYYQKEIETPFYEYFLKNKGQKPIANDLSFDSGINKWSELVKSKRILTFYLTPTILSTIKIKYGSAIGSINHDPQNPVANSADTNMYPKNTFVIENQSFLNNRNDILRFETPILTKEIKSIGQPIIHLQFSSTGTDCDFVVKLIDKNNQDLKLVRMGVVRAKFRKSLENPSPLNPNQKYKIKLKLNEIDYTFLKNHQILIQIQSSSYPLYDINPGFFTNTYQTDFKDYQSTTQKIYSGSKIELYIK